MIGRPPAVDTGSFEQWVAPHWPAMRRLAERLAGRDQRDDVLQDAVSAAWQSWSRFDPERGTPTTWLLAITANQARRTYRRRWRHAEIGDPAEAAAPPDVRVDVQRAVERLPHRQRLAVELHYFVGLPVVAVAHVMGCAEGTVKSTLSAARASLRSILGEDYR